jgi:transcriptional regulator with XRE-family HTH domain
MVYHDNMTDVGSQFGRFLRHARDVAHLSQQQLAKSTSLHQADISLMEKGKRLPSYPQLVTLACVLGVSLQWFLTGSNRPPTELSDLASQLRELGILDLHLANERVPGAFVRDEEAVVLAVTGNMPEARILEAIPAVLAWNELQPDALRALADLHDSRIKYRLAWLADIAITIHRNHGFPGGCPTLPKLEMFIAKVERPIEFDSLGFSPSDSAPPVTQRWKMSYSSPLSAFRERAQRLHEMLAKEWKRYLGPK